MATDLLKIPKIKRQVSMWVHPEGQVIGSLFLREQSVNHAGVEEPIEVLNKDKAFIVLERDEGQVRFYNRNAIIRVEYEETSPLELTLTGRTRPRPWAPRALRL